MLGKYRLSTSTTSHTDARTEAYQDADTDRVTCSFIVVFFYQ
jgi:hypothetical protein